MVTLMDLYAGLLFVGAWMFVMERGRPTVIFWWVLLFCTGNWATVLFVVVKARRATRLADVFLPAVVRQSSRS